MSRESKLLNAKKGLIFRITHISNVPWILDHGLHPQNSTVRDPDFVEIGNPDLIAKRNNRELQDGPGGTLSDYVPFYFTPWSPMLNNIKTGHQGLRQRPMSEIAILVSSVPRLDELGLRYLLSDRHAYLRFANFTADANGLERVDWQLLQSRDFRKDDRERFERYQAEALVFGHVPLEALVGIACSAEPQRVLLEEQLQRRALRLKLVADRHLFL